jgi:predicted NAD-dependent protein-ADP-ribosyltransferase YbiA (DUF1768 family)
MNESILGFFPPYRWASNFDEHPDQIIYLSGYAGQKIACKNIEAAYQASKTFNIEERLKVVNATDKHGNITPGAAKAAGRKVTLRLDWEAVKIDVMLELLTQKFTIPYYRDLLLATGDAYLEETNTWNDTFGVFVMVLGRIGLANY